MSLDSGVKRRNADDDDSQEAGRTVRVLDKMPDILETETMNTDLVRILEELLRYAKMYIETEEMVNMLSMRPTKGMVLYGKHDLGFRVQKYLEVKGKNIVSLWPRNLETLTASRCEQTFQRAASFTPSIVLLIGLEHATADVAQVILRKIRENADAGVNAFVLATTVMVGLVSKDIKECFSVIELQELAESTSGV